MLSFFALQRAVGRSYPAGECVARAALQRCMQLCPERGVADCLGACWERVKDFDSPQFWIRSDYVQKSIKVSNFKCVPKTLNNRFVSSKYQAVSLSVQVES